MTEDKPLYDIVKVTPLEDYQIKITFEEGTEGTVNVAETVKFTGVFEPLKDEKFFKQVKVNPDTGTIEWPNGADLDPVVLYKIVSEKRLILT